jgi:hypothetical protein
LPLAEGHCQQTASFAVQGRLRMKLRLARLLIGGMAVVVASLPLSARADDDNDHDLARDLYERGEIRSLSDILRIVGERAPGDVVAVDLIRVGDHWIYRFQVVSSDGRRTTVDVDAGPVAEGEKSPTGTSAHDGDGTGSDR